VTPIKDQMNQRTSSYNK